MGVFSGNRYLRPIQTLTMRDDPNIYAFGLQDWALLNMKLKERMHFTCADFFVAAPANTDQFITEFLPFGIFAVVSPILGMHSGKNTGRQHRRRVSGAFFIRPIGNHNWVLGFYAQIIQCPKDFQSAQHAKHTVVLSARWLGIQVAAHVNGQRIRVRALPTCKHVAHLVQPH